MTAIDVPIEQASDVFALYDILAEPIERVRQGGGPVMIECSTVRRWDHNGVRDDIAAGFRDAEERELFDRFDPRKVARAAIGEARAEAIEADVQAAVERAYAEAAGGEERVLRYEHV